MGNKIVIISLVILLISIFAAYQLHAVLFYEHPIPQMEETWWGPGERPAKENNKIDIFKISVKNEVSVISFLMINCNRNVSNKQIE